MDAIVTVTGSGQITLPAEIRRELGIEKGDRVRVSLTKSGKAEIAALGSTIGHLKGVVTPPPGLNDPGDFDDLIDEAFDKGLAEEYAMATTVTHQ